MNSEMDKLELYLKENGFDYERIKERKPVFGVFDQIRCGEWDAVCHNGSYGGNKGLLETYGMPEDNGDVTGWLTADDVIKRIAPTKVMDWSVDADTLREEQFICSLSKTEKEIYFVRRDYLNGKCNHDRYEDAVDQLLFYAEEDGIITAEESRRLWKKYMD